MKINTYYNVSLDKGEVNNKPSMTVPDQSMSLRELLDRFARGLPTGGQKTEIWHGEDEDMPDTSKMDLIDRMDLIEANKDFIQETKQKLQSKPPKAIKVLETPPTEDPQNPIDQPGLPS